MPTRRSFRRSIALTACAGLAGALAWLPAGPASAAVQVLYSAEGDAGTSSSCTLTAGDEHPSSPGVSFSSGSKHQNVNLNASFTNTGDSGDVVTMTGHYATSMTVAKKAGDLTKMVVTGKGSVKIHATKGKATACEPTALVDLFSEFEFNESHAGWLYVTRNTVPKQGLAVTLVQDEATGGDVALDVWQGGGSSAVSRGFLTPGTFGGEIAVGLTAGNFPPIFLKSTPKNSISVVFHRSGSALDGAKGSATHFVKFPGSVSCSHHSATLRWAGSASQVASSAFYVNGKKKASVSNPNGGHRVVLRHLSATADNAVSVKLSLKNGGKATASDLYVPCHQ